MREFARQIGISAAFLSDIELGRRYPSDEMLARIAHQLEVELDNLKRLDTRAPLDEMKKMAEDNPTFGIAFRTLLDGKVKAEDLLEWLQQQHAKHRKR